MFIIFSFIIYSDACSCIFIAEEVFFLLFLHHLFISVLCIFSGTYVFKVKRAFRESHGGRCFIFHSMVCVIIKTRITKKLVWNY